MQILLIGGSHNGECKFVGSPINVFQARPNTKPSQFDLLPERGTEQPAMKDCEIIEDYLRCDIKYRGRVIFRASTIDEHMAILTLANIHIKGGK